MDEEDHAIGWLGALVEETRSPLSGPTVCAGASMKRGVVVGALGTAQTLAWASSAFLPAFLAVPIADGLALSRTTVFGVFSGALLVSAFLGPSIGRVIDIHGGRGVLALSNLVLAAGLVLLALTQGVVSLV